MKEIPIKATCQACAGEGLLATGKIFTLAGREHPMLTKCIACEGKGTILTWVNVEEFLHMLDAIAAESQVQ